MPIPRPIGVTSRIAFATARVGSLRLSPESRAKWEGYPKRCLPHMGCCGMMSAMG